MLKKAYNGAYLQVPGLYSYLVETSAGYGISYEMHLDEGYVRSFGLSMKEAFDTITNLLTVYRHKAGLLKLGLLLLISTTNYMIENCIVAGGVNHKIFPALTMYYDCWQGAKN